MKKMLSLLLCVAMLVTTLVACGSAPSESVDNSAAADENTAVKAEPQTVSFWYYHSGDEAAVIEEAIAEYNASQDQYVVEGLSASDTQKLIVALGGNEAPDALFYSGIILKSLQSNGFLASLQPYIDADNFDLSNFTEQSMYDVTADTGAFGLPCLVSTIQMYYNIDLLESIGYTEPPKTVEEMYEMAVKATTLDAEGNIDVLGYPLAPLASARQELIYAFGGRWWDEEGNLTPDDPGILESLNYNIQYRSLYGIEQTQNFVYTANTNRYTEQDMFFAGKQLFRFDGSWLANMVTSFGSDVNYGIAPIPATEANPEALGSSRYETTTLAIPANASNKDGAWDFLKWFSDHDNVKNLVVKTGNLPSRIDLYDDPDVLAIPAFDDFIEALKLGNGVQYPDNENYDRYVALIDEYLDYVYNGIMTPEEAMAELKTQADAL